MELNNFENIRNEFKNYSELPSDIKWDKEDSWNRLQKKKK